MTTSAIDLYHNLLGYAEVTFGEKMPEAAWRQYRKSVQNCMIMDGNKAVNNFVTHLQGLLMYHEDGAQVLTDRTWQMMVNECFKIKYESPYQNTPIVKQIHERWKAEHFAREKALHNLETEVS